MTLTRPSAARPATRPWVRLAAVLALTPPLRLAALRHAVPPGTPRRSSCAACAAPIGLDRPVPALTPVARCPRCRARVGPPPGSVEVAVVAALALLATLDLPPFALLAVGWWLGWAVPLTLVDAAVHRLPDRLTYPAAAGTWLLLGAAALTGAGPGPWVRATLVGLALAAGFAATTLLFGRHGFGLGDAKLALGAGALLGWYGWAAPVLGLLLTFLLSALVSGILLAARRVRWSSHLPFGPFLVVGTAVALALLG
ncbi:leader peptidase (prepilin peptidase) / N-methyltransferase [Micromonospora pallida]|uniref:Leader peptidase (Prepilin peptidase) / N-methyltransferase n=2 Tax=Micromonospora pallida TaxID=145854 RepID=A0A1C6T8L9_9ACTN|nr:A24 family peptidase [Micromonospora pallida]SCL38009.1 leader peptidase (prepilin peptidase) / N-methyltransferase [Micromonospora pallida]